MNDRLLEISMDISKTSGLARLGRLAPQSKFAGETAITSNEPGFHLVRGQLGLLVRRFTGRFV
jgi:hypothetical protein